MPGEARNFHRRMELIDDFDRRGKCRNNENTAAQCQNFAAPGKNFCETHKDWDTPRHVVSEKINHPSHYGGANNVYEAIKIINAHNLNFDLGCVVKYVLRAGKKDGETALVDLKKAAWYLNDEIKKLELGVGG